MKTDRITTTSWQQDEAQASTSASASSPVEVGPSRLHDGSGLQPRPYDGKRWPTVTGELPPHVAKRPRTVLELLPPTAATQQRFDQMSAELRTEMKAMHDAARDAPPLSGADQQLAAYLLARRVDGRPVDTGLRSMLERGNRSLQETRELMSLGRGNVKADCNATNFEGWRTTIATRNVVDALNSEGRELGTAVEAGVVAYTGAGNCDEFALVAAHTHVSRLLPGEKVSHVHHRWLDHAWSQHTGQDGRKVVLDGWKDGPAIEACDAVYASGKPLYDLGRDRARGDRAAFEKGLQETGPELHGRIQEERRQLDEQDDKPLPSQRWDAKPVIGKAFAGRVRRKLDTAPDARPGPGGLMLKARALFSADAKAELQQCRERNEQRATLHNELKAVEAARSLGASVRDATASAPEIVDGAKNLRRTVPRVAPKEQQ